MDNRPIGFFDSGLGGLTCIPHMMRDLPEEKIIYFGDTARTPYGSKAANTIRSFSMEIADFLVKSDVKMIVIACNTVSATCVEDLRKRFPQIPILGIIEPAAKAVAGSCRAGSRIGIIGTKVTISSGAYKKAIQARNPELKIFETACPAFVPLIEEGIIENDIMGCTHYPWIQKNIARIYPDLHIINPSSIIVDTIREIIQERDMAAKGSSFENIFYASDLSENFVNMIDSIFEGEDEDARVKFLNFDLEQGDKYEF